MQVREERSGWRDRELSQRHRRWGWNCPAMDIDFLEFHAGEPVALIECKLEHARPWDLAAKPAQAFVRLADRAALPAFYVVRAADFSWWRVQALNDHARDRLGVDLRVLSEPEFVSLLYALRGLNLPPETAARSYCLGGAF
jgi:hypothetical protein